MGAMGGGTLMEGCSTGMGLAGAVTAPVVMALEIDPPRPREDISGGCSNKGKQCMQFR